MKSIISLLILLIIGINGFAQDSTLSYREGIIKLADYPKFNDKALSPIITELVLVKILPSELKEASRFIFETRSNKIKIDEEQSFWPTELLIKPDTATLRHLHIIHSVWNNRFLENHICDSCVIDSLMQTDLNYNETVTSYYNKLFRWTLGKARPFDIASTNFSLDEYNLVNDTEKTIFLLTYTQTATAHLWGFMNIVRPPNYKGAHQILNQFCTFNNQPYYNYTAFKIEDFDVIVDSSKPKVSFKEYYIGKFYETLYYHYLCLSQKKKYAGEKDDIIKQSILTKKTYWKYCKTPYVFKIGLD